MNCDRSASYDKWMNCDRSTSYDKWINCDRCTSYDKWMNCDRSASYDKWMNCLLEYLEPSLVYNYTNIIHYIRIMTTQKQYKSCICTTEETVGIYVYSIYLVT